MENLFSIGEVSKMFDVSIQTLRYYDKVGILCPQVNENNNYRTYKLKDIYILSIILGARHLEVSINDIKEFLKSEHLDFDVYLDFMNKQSEILNSKIKYLQKINLSVSESKNIIEKAKNYSNIYNFDKLEKIAENKEFYMFPIKELISKGLCRRFSKLIEIENENLEYFTKFNANDNKSYPHDNFIFIEKNIDSIRIVNKIKRKIKLEIESIEFAGEFILVEFLGSEEEIKSYINLLIKSFRGENNNILMKILTFLPSVKKEKSFVQIFFNL